MPKSSFFTTIPIEAALYVAAQEYLHRPMNWQAEPGNRLQQLIVELKEASLKAAAGLSMEQLSSCASNICAAVNAYLEANGFNMKLEDAGSTNMIYAAAILKLAGEFMQAGETEYTLPQIDKPGFRLSKRAGVKHFDFNGRRVVTVETQGGFKFAVTSPTGTTGFDMIREWQSILMDMVEVEGNGVILPMAKIGETAVDVSGLQGLYTPDGWVVQQALMAAKFLLSPTKVDFEAAFAFSARYFSIPQQQDPEEGDYFADHPLNFALYVPGQTLPLAVGLVAVEDLSDSNL